MAGRRSTTSSSNIPNELWPAREPTGASAHKDESHGDAHRHGPPAGGDPRWLGAALTLIIAFMAAEVVAGLAAHSLALISDAAHMLTDAASVGLVLVTMKLAARPPKGSYTYGLKRTEILSAQANGITLVVLAAWLAFEAIRRLISPPAVTGAVVIGVALAGVAVNVAVTMLIGRASRGPRRGLNIDGAFRHILTDVYAFAATAVAGVVIVLTGFARADAIASLVVVALMLTAGAGLIRDSGRVFLEAAPRRTSARPWPPGRTWPRSMTCTSGRSHRGCRPRPRTCSWPPARTATRSGPTWSNCSTTTASRTPPCRSTTRPTRF
jgi:cation diffusion facilitator family transporter